MRVKIQALLLVTVITAGLFTALPLTASANDDKKEPRTPVAAGTYKELTSAVSKVKARVGGEIYLTGDITGEGEFLVNERNITIDLNGYTLTVQGMRLLRKATVNVIGSGSFNINGTLKVNKSMFFTDCNVTVKNPNGNGIEPEHDGTVYLSGNVYANGENSIGILAKNGGDVTVAGNVIATGANSIGVRVMNEHARVYVLGKLSGDGNKVVFENKAQNTPTKTDVLFTDTCQRVNYGDEYSKDKYYVYNRSYRPSDGWVMLGKDWYSFNNGVARTGWFQDIKGSWYFLDSVGRMQTGWLKMSGDWYYLQYNGIMVADRELTIDGVAYNFSPSGVCTNPY